MKLLPTLIAAALIFLPHGASAADADPFRRENLVAWCIVPFDAKKRGPEERAEMLQRLGLRRLAYDWRAEHIPTFDAEVEAMKKRGIEVTAWWFPGAMNDDARKILDVLARHKIPAQLWVSFGDPPGASQEEKVRNAAQRIRPIAEEAAKIGSKVGLYNHGGWFGEPENQLAIIHALELPNVGIVYNFHHGHAHIACFAELWEKMQPHLLCVNLNGMVKDGDKQGKKIFPLGQGNEELAMLRVIRASGWSGPVGILCHRTDADAELVLGENMAGLEGLRKELQNDSRAQPAPARLKLP